MAYIPARDLERLRNGGPLLPAWPEYDPEASGPLCDTADNGFQVSGTEAAVTLLAAHLGRGRPTLQRMLEDVVGSKPGSGRTKRLLDLGREGYIWLQGEGWTLCDLPCEDLEHAGWDSPPDDSNPAGYSDLTGSPA